MKQTVKQTRYCHYFFPKDKEFLYVTCLDDVPEGVTDFEVVECMGTYIIEDMLDKYGKLDFFHSLPRCHVALREKTREEITEKTIYYQLHAIGAGHMDKGA